MRTFDMDLFLERVCDSNDKIADKERVKRQKIETISNEVETMFFEEFLKSDIFCSMVSKILKKIESDEHADEYMTTVSPGTFRILHVIMSVKKRHNYKNQLICDIFNTLKTHFKNNEDALAHIAMIEKTTIIKLLAEKLNQKYQNDQITFESKFHYDDYGSTDESWCDLVLSRTIKI